MECTKNQMTLFDGQNYALWRRRMKMFMQSWGFHFWKEVVEGYTTPATPLTDSNGKKLSENNSKDKNAIPSGMASSIYVKVMHCDSTKDLWDKLQNVYEEDVKAKGAKLQTFRVQF
jgi:hypothetical protein